MGPLAGALLCRSAHQSLKGAPWVGPTLVQCVKHLMVLSVVQLPMLACGEGEAMVVTPPPTRDSAVWPCFHLCLAFPHRHFPPQSPPSHLLDPSLHSQQQPSPWDCSTIPKLQVPATVPSWGLSGVCYGCSKDGLIFIPFRLPQISCFTLSLKCFSSDSDALMWGSDLCFSSPTRQGQVQSY